jgi:PAS domain S-box
LLVEWLRGPEGHDVTTRDPDTESVPEYDAAVVDQPGLRECGHRLSTRRQEADPLYLPHLLVGTDSPPEESPGAELIDDVVSLPVRQAELSRRLGNLLRARRTALRLSNVRDQYEQLVALTPETILLVRDDRVVYVNEAGVDLLAQGGDDVVGEPVDSFVTPRDRATVTEALATVERDGRLREFLDVTLTTTDGAEFPAAVAGVTVTYEGEPASQLVVRDLSEKRQRRQRLTLMNRAVESAAQGITVADANQPEEPLVYANDAFERLTGYDRQGRARPELPVPPG